MAKKSVGDKAAYKHKGMKAPRPSDAMALDASKAPSHKPKHAKKAEGMYMKPDKGQQSMVPEHKKRSLPHKEAVPAVSDHKSQGQEYKMPKSGGRGESEV